ncbi:methyltransferase domain-containing protein [Aeribacillus composti]|uniref:class I SAM-dependent methyltransferase n=1 Tax=Aeribacillus composti TaxID=1868734 RepID=UPI002E21C972|nr:methyltransferase domain-containing protein [Aeribacillus composti]
MKKDSWNAALYDAKHSFVSKFGEHLLDLLEPKKGERILDLGCGTGDLAWKLYELGVDVVGIDKSENMINQAKAKYPGLSFEVKDVLNLGYRNEFDAVFSNAVLHWIKPPKQALINIYQALKENGRFVAEFGGKGNVKTITDAIRNELNKLGMEELADQFPWYFPSIGEYSSLMEEVGFRVVFAQHFDRPTPLHGENGVKNWIEMFAGSLFNDVADDTKSFIITNIENKLKNTLFQNGKWLADYKRIRVIGMKE